VLLEQFKAAVAGCSRCGQRCLRSTERVELLWLLLVLLGDRPKLAPGLLGRRSSDVKLLALAASGGLHAGSRGRNLQTLEAPIHQRHYCCRPDLCLYSAIEQQYCRSQGDQQPRLCGRR
jgi:hypothetical protein